MGTTYVPLMCYYNGELENDASNPIYVGGQMKTDRVSKNISFPEFVLKMHELCQLPPEETIINIKCRCLLDQHMSVAMNVEDENSLSIIMDLYPHHCNVIVAYIEKQSAQKSTTATQRGYPCDLIPKFHNGEASGEVYAREVGSTINTVTHDDLQNCECMHDMVNASLVQKSVHSYSHGTTSSSFTASHLHDMTGTSTEINANNNQLANDSFEGVESFVIDVCSNAANVSSSLPRCGTLESQFMVSQPEKEFELNPGAESQAPVLPEECMTMALIDNNQLGKFMGQSSEDFVDDDHHFNSNMQCLEPVEDNMKSAADRLQDWSSEIYSNPRRQFSTRNGVCLGKIRTELRSYSETTKSSFSPGSQQQQQQSLIPKFWVWLRTSILLCLQPLLLFSFTFFWAFLSFFSICYKIIIKFFSFRYINTLSGVKILDPQDPCLHFWNKILVVSCVISVALDPLFFYILVIDGKKSCLGLDEKLKITVCVMRSLFDIFYILHIIFQFRTALYASSPTNWQEDLVDDLVTIAKQYLSSYFLIDILAVLPLPQVVILIIMPHLSGSVDLDMKYLLQYIVLLQYFPRFLRMYPQYNEIRRTSRITEAPWAGAVFNFSLYMLASHIFGAFWYLLSIKREDMCWRDACENTIGCDTSSLYCGDHSTEGGNAFLYTSCPIIEPNATLFDFGIYLDALQSGMAESRDFPKKLSYGFWWGLQNISSLGQNLKTSTYIWEVCFAVSISIFGMFLFMLLIGNVQTYLQSNSVRLEKEARAKLQNTEGWMTRNSLPESLRQRVRRYEHYKWRKTGGFDDENVLHNLPKDIRRDIKRHLFLNLLRRVPIFEIMDEQLMDAMCDRLNPALHTEGSFIIQEGEPVDEMLFIMRGKLSSVTTDGGRAGFFNCQYLKSGDFCGEELLTWALDPHSSSILPISTRTVHCMTEVEAFALVANDLKWVASQFQKLHSKQLQHTFRFYSQQWRTWAACFIQAAWRRYCKRKLEESLNEAE